VPLSAASLDVIAAVPCPADDRPKGEYLFSTTNGVKPISGYSDLREKLDEKIAAGLAQLNAERVAANLEPLRLGDRIVDGKVVRRGDDDGRWTPHDLRRTMSTRMEGMGIADNVRKAVLNHSRKTDLGVTAVYSHHDFAREKREALDRWAVHLLGIVEPPKAANVMSIADARARAGGAP
jgi:integrase